MFVIQIYVQMNIIALRMAVAGTTEEAAACLQLQIKSKATQLSITTGSIRWRLHLCLDTTMVSKELCLLTTSKTPTRVHQLGCLRNNPWFRSWQCWLPGTWRSWQGLQHRPPGWGVLRHNPRLFSKDPDLRWARVFPVTR